MKIVDVSVLPDAALRARWEVVQLEVLPERAVLLQQNCGAINESEREYAAVFYELRTRGLVSVIKSPSAANLEVCALREALEKLERRLFRHRYPVAAPSWQQQRPAAVYHSER